MTDAREYTADEQAANWYVDVEVGRLREWVDERTARELIHRAFVAGRVSGRRCPECDRDFAAESVRCMACLSAHGRGVPTRFVPAGRIQPTRPDDDWTGEPPPDDPPLPPAEWGHQVFAPPEGT